MGGREGERGSNWLITEVWAIYLSDIPSQEEGQ